MLPHSFSSVVTSRNKQFTKQHIQTPIHYWRGTLERTSEVVKHHLAIPRLVFNPSPLIGDNYYIENYKIILDKITSDNLCCRHVNQRSSNFHDVKYDVEIKCLFQFQNRVEHYAWNIAYFQALFHALWNKNVSREEI